VITQSIYPQDIIYDQGLRPTAPAISAHHGAANVSSLVKMGVCLFQKIGQHHADC